MTVPWLEIKPVLRSSEAALVLDGTVWQWEAAAVCAPLHSVSFTAEVGGNASAHGE